MRWHRALALLVFWLSARGVAAADLTAFVSGASPGAQWSTGYGGALSLSLLGILSLEGEVAKQPTPTGGSMLTATASALVSPPIGAVTLYGGLGVGLFHQSTLSDSDTGSHWAAILGAKWKLGGLLVLKAEYRQFHLSGSPLIPINHRLSAGAGISF